MKNFIHLFIALAVAGTITSCDLALQRNDEYTGSTLDIYQHKTCWEYMESRPDLFTSMMDGLELCGMTDYYTQTTTTYTYLLLTETAIAEKVAAAKTDSEQLQELKDIFLFHIIKGEYHAYGILTYNVTYVDTLLGGESKMSMVLQQAASDRNKIDRLNLMTNCGSSTVVTAVASNYIMTNGPAHILDDICVYIK